MYGQGNSVRIIAAQLGLTKSTVHSIIAAVLILFGNEVRAATVATTVPPHVGVRQ